MGDIKTVFLVMWGLADMIVSVVKNWEFCLVRRICDRKRVWRDTCAPPGRNFTKAKAGVRCPPHAIWSCFLFIGGADVQCLRIPTPTWSPR